MLLSKGLFCVCVLSSKVPLGINSNLVVLFKLSGWLVEVKRKCLELSVITLDVGVG